ncbi:hypothetical protein J23TS9_45010 [Paenibacillus sp. J23TS9]|uniref:VOC family protein n=1 Tax=Paenibacillus sp. J23TS9 TaxID=2807193 RepID=UPI001B144F34|nr:VOC family protein [Paenibacillus sp. J23TS9]GIP29371.1 hypothetical protein J23TS9_45010 [Paenibacillus sp. J23TS9]
MENNRNPIEPMIGSIFIQVHDMKRAAYWYAKLLGDSVVLEPEEKIYSMKLDNLILLLDSHRSETFQPSEHPLFSFSTDDIEKSYEFLINNNVEIFGDIERFPDISFLTIRDSEGNLIMVVQENFKDQVR